MNRNIYLIHRDPNTNKHYRTIHHVADGRIKNITTAVHKLGLQSTAVIGVGLRYDTGYICWVNPRLYNETKSGSCSSVAMIERDPTMRPYIVDASQGRSTADVIAEFEKELK